MRALDDLTDLVTAVLYKGSDQAPPRVKRPVSAWETERRQRSAKKLNDFWQRVGFDD